MTDLIVLGLGLVMLWMIYADRGRIREQWDRPPTGSWNDPDTIERLNAPSHPSKLMFGLPLGIAAVIYGVVGLVT